jgi:hypothetical protein
VTLWTKPGNRVGRVTVAGLSATGVYRSALSAESWADAPITNLVVRNTRIEFAGGGQAELATQPVRPPGVDSRPLAAWGFYARNVERITFEDVRFSLAQDDFRPVLKAEDVGLLELDDFKFPRVEGVAEPFALRHVGRLIRRTGGAPVP